ncbi:MAG: 5-oxoprolinase subunit PxpB [Syntrophobacteraceae bacterium]
MYSKPRILLCGDTGISVEFGDSIDLEINGRVRRLFTILQSAPFAGILDLNPTYRSLFIQYDPWVCSFERLVQYVEDCLQSGIELDSAAAAVKEVPVCYGATCGPDLEEVAAFHGFGTEEVIRLHCTPLYRVYMIGFLPGFAYLGGLDERLHTPRKKDPRKKVAAGSVGIADQQTGIYPIDSPGGWQLIGRTPLKLFKLAREAPFLIQAGDFVRFRPINEEEFEKYSNN